MTTLTQNQTATEFVVSLISVNPDLDADYPDVFNTRTMAVSFDAGVTPDWQQWLETFNRYESEAYKIQAVSQLSDFAEF